MAIHSETSEEGKRQITDTCTDQEKYATMLP
jgi:hypothetical protein